MVIPDVKNYRGPEGKFQPSFGQVLDKFQASFEKGSKWSKMFKMFKMVKLVKNGQNGQKCQICKVQYKSFQMSSSIRLLGGDSMSLTSPSGNNI